jgi:FOG: HEAT repeat
MCLLLLCLICSAAIFAQQNSSTSSTALTPAQRAIERERQRLSSSDTEERRDAVMRLGWMKRPESSRVAANALNDASEIVRATAASAVLSLPADEAAAVLLPLLQDKKEFVRQEAAYALGQTRSRNAVAALVLALERDKLPSVRGAAAVALGMIADESAAAALTRTLDPSFNAPELANQKRRSKKEDNVFVLRAAARALGEIRSRVGVPALIAVMANERADDDLRREAARALGVIGDTSAVPALRAVLTDSDPYLSRIAYESLLKISPAG